MPCIPRIAAYASMFGERFGVNALEPCKQFSASLREHVQSWTIPGLNPALSDHLAAEIFEIPANLTHAQAAWGVTSAVENPQFSTAIGLVKFAQVMHTDRPPRRFGRFIGKFFSGK